MYERSMAFSALQSPDKTVLDIQFPVIDLHSTAKAALHALEKFIVGTEQNVERNHSQN